MTKHQLWEILVPTVSREGVPYRLRFHKVWDSKVRALAGGLTILPVAKGVWVSPDSTLVEERMIPVRIACSEAVITSIMAFTLEYYNQDAVFAYKVSDQCLILHKTS